jgi:NAD(P)-dependent dehydrogenase (short-subunit alcohol dehydrogenase family)
MTMQDVEGKVAFITGGGAGMGLGMAHAFAKAGMKVVIADIRKDALDRALEGFANTNLAVHPIQLDITDRAAFSRAADEAEQVFGNIHLLVNNAGVGVMGPMQDATYDDWDWVTGVILGGTINGVQTVLPRMIKHGEGGHIVNTASLSGVLATPGMGVYVTAKFAVTGMAEALRTDLAPLGIGVSVYVAGATRTELGVSTATTRPASMKSGYAPPDIEQMEKMAERFKNLPPRSDLFMDPMEVGEIVLRGIRRNDLFIWPTAHYRDGIRYRMEALLRGMPDNEVDAETRSMTSRFNDIQVYLDQKQVPRWDYWNGEEKR